jgi:hypothetical protein
VVCFFSVIRLSAQSADEAGILYAEKKYDLAADMYYRLYLFKESADACQMQIDLLVKEAKTEEAEKMKTLLIRAEKAARMVSRCEDIQIIDSVVVDKNLFLSAYFLGESSGKLEKASETVFHENQLGERRFFGKKDADNHFRLHSQLLISGKWSEEKLLNLPIDSLADDNYPFVMPDGLTIYYASTGRESIGGYDLFISRYNMNNDLYLAPNQMGMPFNSIYNDYMLAIDEMNGIGYFVSDRFQPEDKVIVYSFIPNDEFTPVENEDKQVLIQRAKISSIQDTWIPGMDYRAQIVKIRESIEKEKHIVKKDFTFVINDNIVYYKLSDFDSDAAKKSFLSAKDLLEKINAMESQLDTQRKAYAQANAGTKQSLTQSILANEKSLEDLYGNYKKTVAETRNIEIKYLRTKN